MFPIEREKIKNLMEDLIFEVPDFNNLPWKINENDKDAIVMFLTNAWLISPFPYVFYYRDLEMANFAKEMEILYKVSGWLFGQGYLKSSSFSEYTDTLDNRASMIRFLDDKVYLYPYLKEEYLDKMENHTLTMKEVNELYRNIVNYFRENPMEFKYTQTGVVYLSRSYAFVNKNLVAYNITKMSDYDRAEVDIYNSIEHAPEIEEIYFTEIYPEIERQLESLRNR